MKTARVEISESKSMLNRLLILESYADDLSIDFNSRAEDVLELDRCLDEFKAGANCFRLGHGGTTFRFLVTRLSRQAGRFTIEVSSRLADRPHEDLFLFLRSVGVRVRRDGCSFVLESEGWRAPTETPTLDCSRSSQFASALLLNGFELAFDLPFRLVNLQNSRSYWEMSKEVCRQAGMSFEELGGEVRILSGQRVRSLPRAEADMSSAFSVAAIAAVSRKMSIARLPTNSLQGDARFVGVLREMKVDIEFGESGEGAVDLVVNPSLSSLHPIRSDLSDTPDLFPVLAVLCALARGESELRGLGSLQAKESDRLTKTMELIEAAGGSIEKDGEFSVKIRGPMRGTVQPFVFDPDQDHRMAMAAAVLKAAGVPVRIFHPEVVDKSFPGFWDVAGVEP